MNYTVSDLSERWGIGQEQIRRWLRTGKLAGRQDSRKSGWIVSTDSVVKFELDNPKYAQTARNNISKDFTRIS